MAEFAETGTSTGLEGHNLTEVQVTNRILGYGSHTSVFELEFMGLKCAGKKIYEHLLDAQQDTSCTVLRFEEECRVLSQLHHPNIVQFLGVYFQEDDKLPILVMEFLPTNLTSCIDQHGILPKEISYSILYDIALGLNYLHNQSIIHRDLSSNNVLLTSNMTAKITDLGMAKILDTIDTGRMTQCPGSMAYMPPEAMVGNPEYNTSIDEFSYGILMIHVLSGMWPEPLVGPTCVNKDGILVPITEAERRSKYLQAIGDDHPLMHLILTCISNNPKSRACADKIVEQLAEMVLQFPLSFENGLEMLKRIEDDDNEKKQLIKSHADLILSADSHVAELKESFQSERERLEKQYSELNDVYQEEVDQLCQIVKDLKITTTSAQNSTLELPGMRGVHTCGETTVLIGNSLQVFQWKNFGLKLSIAKGSLPSGIEQCILHIVVSLSGQYEFPRNTHCVSAVFWVRCEPVCKFRKDITIEMEHCATKSNGTLCFARAVCTQKKLPYTFELLQGDFTSHSYGVIQINSFSGFTIVNQGSDERKYCAQVFYLYPEIHFAITCNTKAHSTALQNDYIAKGARSGPFQPVRFESDEIKLDIPMEGISNNGWIITPLIRPVVTKWQVDSYEPGQLPPCCQLHTEMPQVQAEVPILRQALSLIGAKPPHDTFTIILPNRGSSVLGRRQPDNTRRPRLMSERSMESTDVYNMELGMSNLFEVCKYINTMDNDQIRTLGGAFGLEFPKVSRMRTPLVDVVAAWLRCEDNVSEPPTWRSMVKALREIGQNGIADKIEREKNPPLHEADHGHPGRSTWDNCSIS